MDNGVKRGYLKENYRFFHLSDKRDVDFESHFHDFHKVIICLSGSVIYSMEGKSYSLQPKQMLLVPKGMIHKSALNSNVSYERIVLWLDDNYLRSFEEDGNSLATCFDMATYSGVSSVLADKNAMAALMQSLTQMESLSASHLFGRKIMTDTLLLQFMVMLNRLVLEQKLSPRPYTSDPKFDDLVAYINSHLRADLSVETLASKFFISRSYLMHRFKELTGCSLHGYITQKRLSYALDRLKQGACASVAAQESGFVDYTVFYRNFKKTFGVAPGEIVSK